MADGEIISSQKNSEEKSIKNDPEGTEADAENEIEEKTPKKKRKRKKKDEDKKSDETEDENQEPKKSRKKKKKEKEDKVDFIITEFLLKIRLNLVKMIAQYKS